MHNNGVLTSRWKGKHLGCTNTDDCPHCANDRLDKPGMEQVRANLTGTTIVATKHDPFECVHRGEPTGELVKCRECDKAPMLKIFACAVHEKCTIAKPGGMAVCKTCRDREAPKRIVINCTADGIGDAILGLTSVAALKRQNPDKEIVYACLSLSRHGGPWQIPWVELFEGYDRLTVEPVSAPNIYEPHETYRRQMREKTIKPRAEYYAEACDGVKPFLPVAKPLTESKWGDTYRGYVVLSPFSHTHGRQWHLSHWLHLERLFSEQGRQCVILDGRTGDKERTHVFRSVVLRDESAARVAAMMAVAACVISNDSGMAHVAGALRVPTVVLSAHIKGEKLYGVYPTALVINGPLPCGDCHWSGPSWRPVCDQLCANLQSINPVDVHRLAQEIIRPLPGYVADAAADREIGYHLSRLCAPAADRRHTMDAFLRAIKETPAPRVLETGCMRSDLDYGAGMSTYLFGRFLKYHGGELISIDSTPQNVEFARSRTRGMPVNVIQTDSRDFLREYDGPPFDGIYLDSQDTWEEGYQDCCLEEAKLAAEHLATWGVILIDDTWEIANGRDGKGAKAVPWLLAHGFQILKSGYQVLLTTLPTYRTAPVIG